MDQLFDNSAIVSSDRVLYTPSAFARDSLLHLQEIGSLTALQPHASSRCDLQSFLFFTVVEGEGKLNYEGKEYELKKGNMVFIDCMKPYSHITSPDQLWTLRWIHFYGAQMEPIYEKYKERGGRAVFYPINPKPFREVWEELFSLASGSDYIRDMRINSSLNNLLLLLMENSWHPEDQEDLPKKKAMLIPVKEYLDSQYGEKITLDGLGKKFFINKYYLSRVFKEQYGMNINSYLLSVRITRAKQLLRFTDKSVEEIGFECGLGAPHYFSTKFKEVEGVSPREYRKQW